ncbi:MAG TPA: divalent-cation tolerance protein CutA [Kiritimatiellia bacterium]|nr:divalent-cation tolerance protein CutA [Kiritimatiellia bacterium]HMO98741.1 divalent-cation tolerance protein CutA [Kiritimatiellia bacterium]HMP95917.1 divalent-cation tolerance protein CutA [Kiritimatiellia bacterium]
MKEIGNPLWVYITAANEDEAERLAELMVNRNVAACVNLLGAIRSVYRWEGRVERGTEFALVAKTTEHAFPRLERLVKEHHSYECPCIIALPITAGYLPYLDWVRGCVAPD